MASTVVQEQLGIEHCWRPRLGRYRRRPRRDTGPEPLRGPTTDLPPVPAIPADLVFDFPLPPSAPASPMSKRPSMPRRQTIVLRVEPDDELSPPPPTRAPPPIPPRSPDRVLSRSPWLQDRSLIRAPPPAMIGSSFPAVPGGAPSWNPSVDRSCCGGEIRHDLLTDDDNGRPRSKTFTYASVYSPREMLAFDQKDRSQSHTTDYDEEDEFFSNTMSAFLTMPPPPPVKTRDLYKPRPASLPILAPATSEFAEGLKLVGTLYGASTAARG